MEDRRIGELLKLAANEPAAPKRLVERTVWKARVAEERLAKQEQTMKKPASGKKAPEKAPRAPKGPGM